MKRQRTPILSLLLLGALGALLFGQALHYPWVFDDLIYLVRNPFLGDWSDFGKLFTDFREAATGAARFGVDGDVSTNLVMRPLTYFTFQINRQIGGLHPAGYRIFNIGVHSLNALLVSWLVSSLLRSPRWELPAKVREGASCLSGTIFLVHPLQIESVTYVIQRATCLCTLFYLLCVVLHLEQRRDPGGSVWRVWLSSACALAAMLCKESGVTAPIVALLLSWKAFGGGFREELRRAWRLLVWLPVVPGLLLTVSYLQHGGLDLSALWSVASAEKGGSYVLKYASSQPEVWWRHWGLFLWPSGLCIDPALAPVKSLASPRLWVPVLAWWGVLLALRAALLRNAYRSWGTAGAVGLGWFLIVLAPDSSVVPLPDLMADHRTYLPLVGACGLTGVLAARMLQGIPAPWGACLSVVLLGALSWTTFRAQQKWSTATQVWEEACKKNPDNLRAWINLGSVSLEASQPDRAVEAFRRSLQIRPTAVAYGNLAVAELKAGRVEQAIQCAQEGLKCPSTGYDYFILGVLGEAYTRLERWSEALAPLEASYQRSQAYAPVVWLLACAYVKTNRLAQAKVVLQKGLRDHPGMVPFSELLGEIEATAHSPQPSPQTPPAVEAPSPAFQLRLGFQ